MFLWPPQPSCFTFSADDVSLASGKPAIPEIWSEGDAIPIVTGAVGRIVTGNRVQGHFEIGRVRLVDLEQPSVYCDWPIGIRPAATIARRVTDELRVIQNESAVRKKGRHLWKGRCPRSDYSGIARRSAWLAHRHTPRRHCRRPCCWVPPPGSRDTAMCPGYPVAVPTNSETVSNIRFIRTFDERWAKSSRACLIMQNTLLE